MYTWLLFPGSSLDTFNFRVIASESHWMVLGLETANISLEMCRVAFNHCNNTALGTIRVF